MLVLVFLGILLVFLLLEGVMTNFQQETAGLDESILKDHMLAYHLDWDAIRDQKLLTYLYVKKVNAVVRYQNLAHVDYEQARDAIEYLLAHPELLPEIPQKRRPPLPEADDERIRQFIAEGRLTQAASSYAALVDVDQFTAQQVVERMERDQYIENIKDTNVERLLLDDDEPKAIHILREKYGLTHIEAVHAIDAMTARETAD